MSQILDIIIKVVIMLSFPDVIFTVKVMSFCKPDCSTCFNTCLYLHSHLKYQQSSLQCFSNINIMVLSQKYRNNTFCCPVLMNCFEDNSKYCDTYCVSRFHYRKYFAYYNSTFTLIMDMYLIMMILYS